MQNMANLFGGWRIGMWKQGFLLALIFTCLAIVPVQADLINVADGKFVVNGDFRLRYESDWDSHRSDGTSRSDRARARIRARLGLQYEISDFLTVGGRFRAGAKQSQQSGNITIKDFDDNPTGDKHVLPDWYFARITYRDIQVVGGRQAFPYWKQNELFWDDDVSILGATGRFQQNFLDQWKLTWMGGGYKLPDGGLELHGNLWAGQLAGTTSTEWITFTTAIGGYIFEKKESTPKYLKDGNGERDYEMWVASAQAKFELVGLPLTLGVDGITNGASYGGFVAFRERKDGYVVSAKVGKKGEKYGWEAGYSLANIELYAVNASYSQDDWARWGSGGQGQVSDFRGHGITGSVSLPMNISVKSTLYLVESILTEQDGKRFRLNGSIKF